MTARGFNWPTWAGFLLGIFAFLSYPTLFVKFPATRDFPWATLLLFAISLLLLFLGLRRAFAANRPHPTRSRITASIVTTLGVVVAAFFVFGFFIFATWLPPSKGAPQVGQKAPDFTLPDTNNNPVSLSQVLNSPVNGKPTTGALLIFYRGYW